MNSTLLVLVLRAVEPSAEFERFVDLLGTRIKLKSWAHFRAGLDTKSTSAFVYASCLLPLPLRSIHIPIHLLVIHAFSYSLYCAITHTRRACT